MLLIIGFFVLGSLSLLSSCSEDDFLSEQEMIEKDQNRPKKKGPCYCPDGSQYSWYCGAGSLEVCVEQRICPPIPPGGCSGTLAGEELN